MTRDGDPSESRAPVGRGDAASAERFLEVLHAVLRDRPAVSVAWVCEGDDGGPVLWDLYRALPAATAKAFRRGWAAFGRSAGASELASEIGRIVATDVGGRYFAELHAAGPWHDPARVELTGTQLARVLTRELRARRRSRSAPRPRSESGARKVGVPELAKKLAALGELDRSGDPVTVSGVRSRLAKPERFPPEYAELAGKKSGGQYPEPAALAFLAAAERRLRAYRRERDAMDASLAASRAKRSHGRALD